MDHKTKAHVVLPMELLQTIDGLVGKRKRSKFMAEAAREKIAREKYVTGLEQSAGAWTDENHPHLTTLEDLTQYLDKARHSYLERTDVLNHE